MTRVRHACPGRPSARRTLPIVALCIFAVLNQPLSLLLHGWQERHPTCSPPPASTAAVQATTADTPRSAHDTASCPICRTASQARYSLVVSLAGATMPAERQQPALDEARLRPAVAAPPTDAPRAPPALA